MKIRSLLCQVLIPAGCLALAGLSGCAIVDQKIGLTYSRPDLSLVRHSGDITVTRVAPRPAATNSFGEWIIGSLNNVNGVHQADLLSDRSPDEWISDALLHELRQAGYTVNYAEALPATVARGLAVTGINTFLAVNKGTVSADTRQELKFNVEVYVNGEKVKTLTVASRDNRTVPLNASQKDKERIMLQSLQDAMQQIIPEIIALIDKK
jgi:Uncharacterized lipoprotein